MIDPVSMSAIAAVFGAVGSGMASEAGKLAWESAGGLVRRLAGREVPAPATADELDAVARMVHDRVRDDPELALIWTRFARGVRTPGRITGPGRHCLPPAPRSFTDRQEALKLLDKEARRPFDGRPRLALLHGPEGIGTSTLAHHWGARQTHRFPDGQLYADLRTLGPEPVLMRARVPDDGDLGAAQQPGEHPQRDRVRGRFERRERERFEQRGCVRFGDADHAVEEAPEAGGRLAGYGAGEGGRGGRRTVGADESGQLGAQRECGVQAGCRADEGVHRGVGGEAGEGRGAEEDGGAERGGVVGHRAVVADDRVGGEQRLTPAVQRVDEGESGAAGPVEPGADLARTVAVPDVGVQDGGETVLVDGEFGGQPGEQGREYVVAAGRAVAEQGLRVPRGIEDHQALGPADAERPPVAFPVRARGEHAVPAGITGQYGRGRGLGADGTQPLHLLGVGQHQRVGDGLPAVVEQPLGRQPENRNLDLRRLAAGCWVLGVGCWVLGVGCPEPLSVSDTMGHHGQYA